MKKALMSHSRTRRSSLTFSIPVIVFQLAAMEAVAQNDQRSDPGYAWVTAGLGLGTEGFAGVLGFDILNRQHLVSFRGLGLSEVFGDNFWDLGVLFGRARRSSRSLLAASAGLAIMGGETCISGCAVLHKRVSFPLGVRAAWHPASFLGLGIYGFANFNSVQSFAGGVVTIEIGHLH